MNNKEFLDIFNNTMTELKRLVEFKGEQYATNQNRLHNFDRASVEDSYLSDTGKQLAPIQACRGMWKKQYVALIDAIDGRDSTWTQARCEEVINDLLVYLILTKALFYRANGWTTPPISDTGGSYPSPPTTSPYTRRCICGERFETEEAFTIHLCV